MKRRSYHTFVIPLIVTGIACFVLGFYYGLGHGLTYYDDYRLWTCTCKREDRCKFFGRYEKACEVAINCRKADDEFSLVRMSFDIDPNIKDVSS